MTEPDSPAGPPVTEPNEATNLSAPHRQRRPWRTPVVISSELPEIQKPSHPFEYPGPQGYPSLGPPS